MKKLIITGSLAAFLAIFPTDSLLAQHWNPAEYPLELIAPYLLQAGQTEAVIAQLKARPSYDMTADAWNALWIKVPETSDHDFGVYKFRKDLELKDVPKEFIVHVSGDTRYKLYVNGSMVSMGPSRSYKFQWRYETLDLAPYLKEGKNVIASLVWNEGSAKAIANSTIRSGFLLMGEGEAQILNTDNSWKCIQDKSVTPLSVTLSGYYALGPAENVDMKQAITNWQSPDYNLSDWKDAQAFSLALPHDTNSQNGGYTGTHLLVSSPLPQMERKETRFQLVRKDGGLKLPADFPATANQVTVPAHLSTDLLLDNKELTNAFFHMAFSKGKDAKIGITYAETLYSDNEFSKKGNRNEVEGKFLSGKTDQVISSGADNQQYTTMDWRTYRYVNLHIETGDEPLILNDLGGTFVGYPFQMNAQLDTDNQELKDILETGWRTARLCAQETYVDCPYYEQLQYLGDTRIQALISLFNSGDDRLVKNYLRQSDLSRNAEGITMGRAPSDEAQYITPYALCYIYAIHDYMRYGSDQELVKELLPGAEQILNYFYRYQQTDGRLKNLPGWNFSDWVYGPTWQQGMALRGADGSSSLMDFQLLYGYQKMAELEKMFGHEEMSLTYTQRANQLKESIQQTYWSADRGLYSDRIEKDNFSQHANSWAILCGMGNAELRKEIGRKLTEDKTLAPCSLYYSFYLMQALTEAGYGNDLLKWLDPWRENLAMGLTTWAEDLTPDTSRSDCHAWGATPNIEFFRTLLGIDSSSPAFATVKIEPHLGDIKQIGGTMPHPKGKISVSYKVSGSKLKATIELPENVTGTFVWEGKTTALHAGKNEIK